VSKTWKNDYDKILTFMARYDGKRAPWRARKSITRALKRMYPASVVEFSRRQIVVQHLSCVEHIEVNFVLPDDELEIVPPNF